MSVRTNEEALLILRRFIPDLDYDLLQYRGTQWVSLASVMKLTKVNPLAFEEKEVSVFIFHYKVGEEFFPVIDKWEAISAILQARFPDEWEKATTRLFVKVKYAAEKVKLVQEYLALKHDLIFGDFSLPQYPLDLCGAALSEELKQAEELVFGTIPYAWKKSSRFQGVSMIKLSTLVGTLKVALDQFLELCLPQSVVIVSRDGTKQKDFYKIVKTESQTELLDLIKSLYKGKTDQVFVPLLWAAPFIKIKAHILERLEELSYIGVITHICETRLERVILTGHLNWLLKTKLGEINPMQLRVSDFSNSEGEWVVAAIDTSRFAVTVSRRGETIQFYEPVYHDVSPRTYVPFVKQLYASW